MRDIPVELSMNKKCKSCGTANVVPICKLGSAPLCAKCKQLLDITDLDRSAAKAMLDFANKSGENVKTN